MLEDALGKTAPKEAAFGNARLLGGESGAGGTMSTSSTSFVDLGAGNHTRKTFTKKAADTDLLVVYVVSGFVSTGTAADVTIGVQIDSSDNADDAFRVNAGTIPNVHIAWGGQVAIAGIGSGDRAVELRCRVGDGSDTFETNGSDKFSYLVWEVPASLSF